MSAKVKNNKALSNDYKLGANYGFKIKQTSFPAKESKIFFPSFLTDNKNLKIYTKYINVSKNKATDPFFLSFCPMK